MPSFHPTCALPPLARPLTALPPHPFARSYDTIRTTGCTLSVSFMWTCFVDSSARCSPQLQVSRMDVNERRRGFQYQYANYYRPTAGGESTRDLNTVRGVR